MCAAASAAAASFGSTVSVNRSEVSEFRTDATWSAMSAWPAGVSAAVQGASFFARLATTSWPPSKGISIFATSSGFTLTSCALAHPFASVSSQTCRLEKYARGSLPNRMKRPLPWSGVFPSVTLQISLPAESSRVIDESLNSRRARRSGLAVTNRSTLASFRSWTKRDILSKSAGMSK